MGMTVLYNLSDLSMSVMQWQSSVGLCDAARQSQPAIPEARAPTLESESVQKLLCLCGAVSEAFGETGQLLVQALQFHPLQEGACRMPSHLMLFWSQRLWSISVS